MVSTGRESGEPEVNDGQWSLPNPSKQWGFQPNFRPHFQAPGFRISWVFNGHRGMGYELEDGNTQRMTFSTLLIVTAAYFGFGAVSRFEVSGFAQTV